MDVFAEAYRDVFTAVRKPKTGTWLAANTGRPFPGSKDPHSIPTFPYDSDGPDPYLVAMVLDTHPSYPTTRSYVIKLHRDAVSERGFIFGRLGI